MNLYSTNYIEIFKEISYDTNSLIIQIQIYKNYINILYTIYIIIIYYYYQIIYYIIITILFIFKYKHLRLLNYVSMKSLVRYFYTLCILSLDSTNVGIVFRKESAAYS